MQMTDIKNVLTFAAFRPEPEDPAATWSTRFPNKRTLLLNVNRNYVRWQIMLKGGELGEGGVENGELKEVVQAMGEEWKGMIDDGICSVSINNRFILSLEANLSRKKGYEDLLRSNPKSVLGGKYERGKTYALLHHPDTNSSLLLATEDTMIKEVQDLLKRVGLRTCRVCCGVFAMVCDVLYRIHEMDKKKGRKEIDEEEDQSNSTIPPNYLLIVCCEGSVCILKQKDQHWTELRSRSAFYQPGDLSSLMQILQPMLSDWDLTAPILFASDTPDPRNLEQLRQMLPGVVINDVTTDTQLWTNIGKN